MEIVGSIGVTVEALADVVDMVELSGTDVMDVVTGVLEIGRTSIGSEWSFFRGYQSKVYYILPVTQEPL